MKHNVLVEIGLHEGEDDLEVWGNPSFEFLQDHIAPRIESLCSIDSGQGCYGEWDYFWIEKDDEGKPRLHSIDYIVENELKAFAFLNNRNAYIDRDFFEYNDEPFELFDEMVYGYLKKKQKIQGYSRHLGLFIGMHN